MFIKVLGVAYTGKNYVATVRIEHIDLQVSHKPVSGESRADIDAALIQAAKDKLLSYAIKNYKG